MPTKMINGVQLFYNEMGSGEPILFHHGYTGAHDVWLDEISPRLKDRFHCIVMDCRGAGDSGHSAIRFINTRLMSLVWRTHSVSTRSHSSATAWVGLHRYITRIRWLTSQRSAISQPRYLWKILEIIDLSHTPASLHSGLDNLRKD